MPESAPLRRQLGLADAVALGLSSILGAGVFVVFSPAAALTGTWLPVAVLLAGLMASWNGASSARLAMVHSSSGGGYLFGRQELGEIPGVVAGWCFIAGKTASAAAMAMVVSAHLSPTIPIPGALAALTAMVLVNIAGISRTAGLSRILLSITALGLLLVLISALVGGANAAGRGTEGLPTGSWGASAGGPSGILTAAALIFFAFAGYARITTLAEEVSNPVRTIPRAVAITLGVSLVLYLALAMLATWWPGPAVLASTPAPLAEVALLAWGEWAGVVVSVTAGVAALGALLSVIAGTSRTVLAMARDGELPRFLANVNGRGVPVAAEILSALGAALLILSGQLTLAISVSGFCVLLYYAVVNASALRLATRPEVASPWWAARPISALGFVACLACAFSLPLPIVLGTTAVLALALLIRAAPRHRV